MLEKAHLFYNEKCKPEMHLSLVEVRAYTEQEVLKDLNNNILSIFGDAQGNLDQQPVWPDWTKFCNLGSFRLLFTNTFLPKLADLLLF